MASVQSFREGRYQRLAILQLFDVFGLWTLHAYSRLDPRYVLLRIPSISAKERDAQFRNCECNIARSFQHSWSRSPTWGQDPKDEEPKRPSDDEVSKLDQDSQTRDGDHDLHLKFNLRKVLELEGNGRKREELAWQEKKSGSCRCKLHLQFSWIANWWLQHASAQDKSVQLDEEDPVENDTFKRRDQSWFADRLALRSAMQYECENCQVLNGKTQN